MNDIAVFYKVVLDNSLYVSDYKAELMWFSTHVTVNPNDILNVSVTNKMFDSEDIPYRDVAIEIAKYVKGAVIKYTLTVDSTEHEIIADYRGENNDPQTS